MATPNFYDENLYRCYPFKKSDLPTRLPQYIIVDCGFILLPGSNFNIASDTIHLISLKTSGANLIFKFGSTASTLSAGLSFTVPFASTSFTTIRATSSLWSGFIVIGDMSAIQSLIWTLLGLAPGTMSLPVVTLTFSAVTENSRIKDLSRGFIKTINIANADRLRATTADGCREFCWTYEETDYRIVQEGLIGKIVFSPGYNAELRQESANNAIVFSGDVGSGAGQPCTEVPLYVDEEPPAGRTLLSGALTCSDVVRSINGVGGRFFSVKGGNGVRITAQPENNKIIVDIGTNNPVSCVDTVDVAATTVAPNANPCDCGDTIS